MIRPSLTLVARSAFTSRLQQRGQCHHSRSGYRDDACVIGLGAGVYDRCKELGLPVRGVNVGEAAASRENCARLRDELWFKGREWFQDRACSGRPDLFVAATRWDEAGKIDYALHGKMPVLCLAREPHGYGVLTRPKAHIGEDALIIGRDLVPRRIQRNYGSYFESIEELPPITILHAGKPAFQLSLYFAQSLRDLPERPNLLDPLPLSPAPMGQLIR